VLQLYFAGDEKVKHYFDEISAGKAEGFTCEENLAEFYARTCLLLGSGVADTRYFQLRRQQVLKLVPLDEAITRLTGRLKCKHRGKVSLVDCSVAATAKTHKASLITTDGLLAEVARSEGISIYLIEVWK
jgi:predicted nucleic acid-binding protein